MRLERNKVSQCIMFSGVVCLRRWAARMGGARIGACTLSNPPLMSRIKAETLGPLAWRV